MDKYIEQIKWERDLAIRQLKDLGYGLGEKQRIGKWLEEYDYMGFHVCSECGYKTGILSKFCPGCGVRMEMPNNE